LKYFENVPHVEPVRLVRSPFGRSGLANPFGALDRDGRETRKQLIEFAVEDSPNVCHEARPSSIASSHT
jgi:hypothetical protein